jgi:hypothetical protein
VPTGISDATVPNPIFNLTPAATVDEGNNWINISWGPMSLTSPLGVTLGNYGPAAGSPVINYVPSTAATYPVAPSLDFYGTQRKTNNAVDAGAVEFTGSGAATPTLTSVAPNTGVRGTSVNVTFTGANLTGATGVNGFGANIPVSNFTVVNSTTVTATFTIGATAPVGARTIRLTTSSGNTNTVTFTVQAAVSISPSPLTITLLTGATTGTGTVTFTNNANTGGASVNVSTVAVTGGNNVMTWFFSKSSGADTCTGTPLAPKASCTVGVQFTNVGAVRGVNRTGSISFTDSATGSPQAGVLRGFANP